jgi:hypothetical protein
VTIKRASTISDAMLTCLKPQPYLAKFLLWIAEVHGVT